MARNIEKLTNLYYKLENSSDLKQAVKRLSAYDRTFICDNCSKPFVMNPNSIVTMMNMLGNGVIKFEDPIYCKESCKVKSGINSTKHRTYICSECKKEFTLIKKEEKSRRMKLLKGQIKVSDPIYCSLECETNALYRKVKEKQEAQLLNGAKTIKMVDPLPEVKKEVIPPEIKPYKPKYTPASKLSPVKLEPIVENIPLSKTILSIPDKLEETNIEKLMRFMEEIRNTEGLNINIFANSLPDEELFMTCDCCHKVFVTTRKVISLRLYDYNKDDNAVNNPLCCSRKCYRKIYSDRNKTEIISTNELKQFMNDNDSPFKNVKFIKVDKDIEPTLIITYHENDAISVDCNSEGYLELTWRQNSFNKIKPMSLYLPGKKI